MVRKNLRELIASTLEEFDDINSRELADFERMLMANAGKEDALRGIIYRENNGVYYDSFNEQYLRKKLDKYLSSVLSDLQARKKLQQKDKKKIKQKNPNKKPVEKALNDKIEKAYLQFTKTDGKEKKNYECAMLYLRREKGIIISKQDFEKIAGFDYSPSSLDVAVESGLFTISDKPVPEGYTGFIITITKKGKRKRGISKFHYRMYKEREKKLIMDFQI